MANIVVVTNGNFFANLILQQLFDGSQHRVCGVVVVNGDYGGYTGFRALWRLAKVTTPPYLLYKLFIYVFFKAVHLVTRREWEVLDVVKRRRIPYLVTPSVNTDEVERFVEECNTDVLVSVSCPQRIRKRLRELSRLGGINIHSSLLPAYAGLAPYLWVLARGESTTGTTIHYLTERFDEGNVLLQQQCAIPDGISAFALFAALARLGRELLPRAVDLVVEGNCGKQQDLTQYSYFSHPHWLSYSRLRSHGHRLIRLIDLVNVCRNREVSLQDSTAVGESLGAAALGPAGKEQHSAA